jgi:AcrR family transcriptional regulator
MNDATPQSPRMERMRARILEAAERVFLSDGYRQASMDAVAAKAGVSKQTVYAHFRAKETLFLAVTRAMTDAAIAAQTTAAPDPAADADILSWLLDHAVQQLETARNHRLMQLRRIAIAEAERFPDVGAAVFDAGPARAIARLARIFAIWHDAGRLNAPDPQVAARTFNWLIMGGPTSEAMLLGQARLDATGAKAHASECVRVFLAAYRE